MVVESRRPTNFLTLENLLGMKPGMEINPSQQIVDATHLTFEQALHELRIPNSDQQPLVSALVRVIQTTTILLAS